MSEYSFFKPDPNEVWTFHELGGLSRDEYSTDGRRLIEELLGLDAIIRLFGAPKLPENSGSSRWFKTDARKQAVYDGSKKLAQYCRDNEIVDAVYIDRSARPARLAMNEYWKLAYPEEGRPDAHFLDPSILKLPGLLDPSMKDSMTHACRVVFENKLEESHSTLLNHKDRPVLLFDGCIHSGRTMGWTKKMMEDTGFQDIRVVVHNDTSGANAMVSSDMMLVDNPSWMESCRPFGRDDSIRRKTKGSDIYSELRHDPLARVADIAMRQEIRTIISAGFAAEQSGEPPIFT